MIRSLVPIAFLALSVPALATDLRIECHQGIAPGPTELHLAGDPNQNVLLFVRGDVPGVQLSTLLVPSITPLRDGPNLMVLYGTLDASGAGIFSFTAQQALAGHHVRYLAHPLQFGTHFSNACRETYLASQSCGAADWTASSLSFFGDLFPLARREMLAIGGAGPLVTAYDGVAEATTFNGLLPLPPALFQSRVQLGDGRVLLCGGLDLSGAPIADAELYDPTTGTTTSVGSMISARAGAAATLLGNGKVLVVGGLSVIDLSDPTTFFNGILGTSELFDPATNAFTAGPTLLEKKAFASATLLDNGQVLVAGGLGVIPILNIPFVSNTAYVYNTNGSFGLFPKLFTDGRMFHAATKLADGRVLLTGGLSADLSGVLQSGDFTQIVFGTLGTSPLYTTSSGGQFSNGPVLGTTRAFQTATRLLNGQVLVAGGINGSIDIAAILSGNIQLPTTLDSTELLSATSAAAGPALTTPRAGASALLDPADGRVVILGGGAPWVDLYQP
jgi:hypothetical protein